MAIPIAPTANSIINQALKEAQNLKEIGRGAYWLRSALARVLTENRNKLAETTAISNMIPFKSRFPLPVDMKSLLNVRILTGSEFDDSTAATSNTITLAAGEDITVDFAEGKSLFTTSGNGINQEAMVIDYNDSTSVATISPDWDIVPDAGSGYMFINDIFDIKLGDHRNNDNVKIKGVPTEYFVYGSDPDEIEFNAFVDGNQPYVMKIDYILEPMKIDLTSSKLARIYIEYEAVLVAGVAAMAAQKRSIKTDQNNLFQKLMGTYNNSNLQERMEGLNEFRKRNTGLPL